MKIGVRWPNRFRLSSFLPLSRRCLLGPHLQLPIAEAEQDAPPLIRAQHVGSRRLQPSEGLGAGVTVVVVGAHAEEGSVALDRLVETGILICTSVVRDLHDRIGTDTHRAKQGALGLGGEIAEIERTRHSSPVELHHDTRVIASGEGGGCLLRPENTPCRRPQLTLLARRGLVDPRSGLGELIEETLIGLFCDGTMQNRRDTSSDGCGPADMVEIEVGEDEEIDAFDSE